MGAGQLSSSCNETVRASKAIPQIGQLPGPSKSTSGCIGQVNSFAPTELSLSTELPPNDCIYSAVFFEELRSQFCPPGTRFRAVLSIVQVGGFLEVLGGVKEVHDPADLSGLR